QLPNLDPLMRERYPGYQYDTSTPWWPSVEEWSYTGLNTLRGSLDTVHEQLRPEQRLHEDEVLAALKAQTEAAAGNLGVSQTGNMIGLQVAQELRKLRQMVGAQTNALAVAQAHEIHLKAVSERVAHDLLANSPSDVPTAADGNSFTLLGPTRSGGGHAHTPARHTLGCGRDRAHDRSDCPGPGRGPTCAAYAELGVYRRVQTVARDLVL